MACDTLKLTRSFGLCAALAVLANLQPSAASAQTLSAQESDPRVMGWMEGFPPPPDRLITQPDSNYFSFPKLRWSVCHLRERCPSKSFSNAFTSSGISASRSASSA